MEMRKNIVLWLASFVVLWCVFPASARGAASPAAKTVIKTPSFASSFLFDSLDDHRFVGLAVMNRHPDQVNPFIYDVWTKQVKTLPVSCKDSITAGDDARRLLAFPVKASPDKKKLLCSDGLDLIVIDAATGQQSRIAYDEIMTRVPPKEPQPEFQIQADWGYDSGQLIVTRGWVNGHRSGISAIFVYTIRTKEIHVLNLPEDLDETHRTVVVKALDTQRLLLLSNQTLALYNIGDGTRKTLMRLGKDETFAGPSWTPGWLRFATFSDGKQWIVSKYNETKNKTAYLSLDLTSLKIKEIQLRMEPSEQLLAFWGKDAYVAGKIVLREYKYGKDQVQLHVYDKGKMHALAEWSAGTRSINDVRIFKTGKTIVVANTNDNESTVYGFR